jgi:biopolymer transport protein ExbD
MRFPRTIKPFRGQLELAPFLSVAFLLAIMLMFGSSLVFTPGVPIHLPETAELPGTSNPTITVAVDAGGHFYYDNQITDESKLKEKLLAAVDQSKEPLTLVVQMDEQATQKTTVQLGLLAREVGIKDLLYATRPQATPVPIQAPP